MDETPQEPERVPAYVALVRIAAVIGMSTAAAFGLFLAIAALWLPSLVAFALTIPFFLVMRFVEGPRRPEAPPSS